MEKLGDADIAFVLSLEVCRNKNSVIIKITDRSVTARTLDFLCSSGLGLHADPRLHSTGCYIWLDNLDCWKSRGIVHLHRRRTWILRIREVTPSSSGCRDNRISRPAKKRRGAKFGWRGAPWHRLPNSEFILSFFFFFCYQLKPHESQSVRDSNSMT